jgi:hypothetical protein
MISVLYALLEAVSKELDIERNDIKGCLCKAKSDSGMLIYDLIIYDSVAGGAGHSRRLVTSDGKALSNIIHKAIKQMDECDCEPSCYKCLRNYYNQKIHNLLNRKTASTFLRNYSVDPIEIVESIIEDSLEVTIAESMRLSEDYPTWQEAESVLDDNDVISVFKEHKIPIAELIDAQLTLGEIALYAVFVWETQKVAICESVSEVEKIAFVHAGWTVLQVGSLDIEELKRALGDMNNG